MRLVKRPAPVEPIPCRWCRTVMTWRDRESQVFCGWTCKESYLASPMYKIPDGGWVGGYWPTTWEALRSEAR